MAFKKGIVTNPTGRKPGSTNRTTGSIRAAFQLLVENNLEKMQKDLDSMEPEKRVSLIIKLSEFVLPRLQSLSVENQVEIEYTKLERLLATASPEAIDLIVEKIQQIKLLSNETEKN